MATERPLDRDPLTPHVLEVADAVGSFIEWWGFKHVHGRIWAVLALHREPLAQTDIASLLGVSRSLVSTSISELAEYGLVEPVDDRRNAPWRASMDVWKAIARVLRSREWLLIEKARIAAEAAHDEASMLDPRDPDDHTAWDTTRIGLLLRLTELAQGTLRMIIGLGSASKKTTAGFGRWLDNVREFTNSLRSS